MTVLAVHGARWLIAATVAGNLAASLWGFIARRRVGRAFWWFQIVLGALAALEVLAGLVLVLGGSAPRVWLHWLYGAVTAILIVGQIGLRPGGIVRRAFVSDDTRWDAGRFMALWCLFLAGVLLRAYQTGLGR